MSISVNGQSQVPPGFRFHPTEEELLHYYLRKKVSYEKIDLDVIRDVDLNKLEPWDIQEKCKIGTTPQNDWYFFSHKDKKYPTGSRTNRATAVGFWKATGRDKVIFSNCRRIGMRKTLVFYKGRAPHGLKSDWIMHEYRLDDNTSTDANIVSSVMGETVQEEGWVVCRIFKKKNHLKTLDSTGNESRGSRFCDPSNEGSLELILQQMERTCNEVNLKQGRSSLRPIDTVMNNDYFQDRFFKLPRLESPVSTCSQTCYQPIIPELTPENNVSIGNHPHQVNGNSNSINADRSLGYHLDSSGSSAGLTNWAALDRLVASQLNGCQTESSTRLACFSEPTLEGYCSTADEHDHLQLPTLRSSSSSSQSTTTSSSSQRANYINPTMYDNSEIDQWSFGRSTSSLPNVEIGRITE